jgi:iron complex outermembrane recepter protein
MIRSTVYRSGTGKRLLASAAVMAMAMPFAAFAQDAQADGASEAGDIIVTARRADERLQDVPVSVQVVTGDSLQKLAITSADELGKLAPGLTLVNAGASTQVSLRGVSWRPGSGTPATPIYFNDVGFDPGQTVASIFDVGQIEVLRGPQGTSRGAPSISGAVTLTTRKPDLAEFGGYAQGFYGSANHWNIQAAVNLPVIKDVLAIRLATNIENSEGDRIYSVRSAIEPSVKDRSFRATVLLKPTDTLSIQAMYQRRKTNILRYTQVQGTGSPGAPASATAFFGTLGAIPANFNGPALTLAQRASVQDAPSIDPQHVDLLTINASWEVFGQKLSYNFGRQFNRQFANFTTSDPLNMLPGFESYTSPENAGLPKFRVHELRLSGNRVGGSPISYDIGWYSKHSGGQGINFRAPTYLAGAFGAPNALPGAVTTPNPAYVLNSLTNIKIGQSFDSFYGNLKANLGEKTELSGGLAFVKDRVPVALNIQTFAARTSVSPYNVVILSVPAAFRPFFPTCESISAALITSPTYAGVCDSPIPNGVGNSVQNNDDKYSTTLYNFSLSHKFTDDLMVYATTGSSFRTGLPAINNNGLPANLVTPLPEKAKSYEIGIKASFGRGLRVNAALFQIDYGNQLTTFEGVQYFNTISNRTALTSLAFYRNVDSRVRGFELEVAAKPTDNLSLGANLSYSQIKSRGGNVPCNDPARPITAANPINFCPSPEGQVLNQDAPFNATVNGAYTVPLGSLEGYFRFNLSIKGNNPNFGNFPTAGVFRPTPSYAILDLYAGITGQENVWELGFFAKNVTNKQVELSRTATLNNIYSPYAVAPSGYNTVRTSLPRELGVSLRYSFGSR